MKRAWRKIVKREKLSERTLTSSRRGTSYVNVLKVKLTLKCGHIKTVHEYGVPKNKVDCKVCKKREKK